METLIETSKAVPVSGSILIDKKKAMELVDQMRLAIPQEVRAAEEVLSHKDHIVNQAQVDARRTKAKAEDEFRQKLDQSELVAKAVPAWTAINTAFREASVWLKTSTAAPGDMFAVSTVSKLCTARCANRVAPQDSFTVAMGQGASLMRRLKYSDRLWCSSMRFSIWPRLSVSRQTSSSARQC